MVAAGIIRRVDDIGRIMIPKEIRSSLNLKEGTPLEIYVSEGEVIFRRYDPIPPVAAALEYFKTVVEVHPELSCRTEMLQSISELEARLNLERRTEK